MPPQVYVIHATTRQHIYPVLIQRDYNALLQVRPEAEQSNAFPTSIYFLLEGTDDLTDPKSLQVSLTSKTRGPEFSADTPLGR